MAAQTNPAQTIQEADSIRQAFHVFSLLSQQSKQTVVDFMNYLADQERTFKAENIQQAFSRIQSLLDGDTGWQTEEEMMEELLQDRRIRRMAKNEDSD